MSNRIVVVVTGITSGIAFADMLAVNTALPFIQRGFGVDAADAHWIAEIYLLFVASVMMTGGALADRWGTRTVLTLGMSLFTVSSLLCALSGSTGELIGARGLQGMSAALMAPASMALINASFPPGERGKAIGTWAAVSSLMIPFGPLIGGVAVDYATWHWIFFLNLPIGVVVLCLMRFVPVPAYENRHTRPIDWFGACLSILTLGALVFGLLEASRRGFSSVLVQLSFLAGGVSLVVFIFSQRVITHPMLPLQMLSRNPLMALSVMTLLLFGGFQSGLYFLPFLMAQGLGYSALAAGAAGLPIALCVIAFSRLVGKKVDRLGPRVFLIAGPLCIAAGLAWLSRIEPHWHYFPEVGIGILAIAVGTGLVVTPLTALAVAALGPQNSGLASGINNSISRVGMLIGIAVMVVVLTGVFRSTLIDTMAMSELPAASREAILENVAQLAELKWPQDLDSDRVALLSVARTVAFLQGIGQVMLLAATMVMCSVFLVPWASLRAREDQSR